MTGSDTAQLGSLDREVRATTRPRRAGFGSPWIRARWNVLVAFLVWLAGAAFFFRAEWSRGFRRIMGDNYDTVHLTYLQEHWFQVLHGHAALRSPAFFYPTKGLLGWSDGLVLFQIFYTPLRYFGCDMFLASALTVVALSLVGFVGFVCLARVAFGANTLVALIGGLAFTFANNLWVHLQWVQLLTVWLVPGILLLGVFAFRALPLYRVRSLVLGSTAGLLAALAFFTDFYTAWFATLAGAIVLIILVLSHRQKTMGRLLTKLRDNWQLVLTVGLSFMLGLVPFVLTYLPTHGAVDRPSYAAVMRDAPGTRDLLDAGAGNLVWGAIVHRVVPTSQLSPLYASVGGYNYAVTPLLLTLAVVGSAIVLWRSKREGPDRGRPVAARAAAVLAVTAVVLSLLPVRTDAGSLWAVIWRLPGASVIKQPGRIGVVAGLAASLAVVCAASEAYKAPGKRPFHVLRRATVVVVLLLVVVEQINTSPMAELDRSAELAFLRSTKAPPASCRSFFVSDATHSFRTSATSPYRKAMTYQLDAMLVSQKYSLPTLNGHTSYQPVDWDLMDPDSPDYLAGVRSWADGNHVLDGLCQLDLGTMTWHETPALSSSHRSD